MQTRRPRLEGRAKRRRIIDINRAACLVPRIASLPSLLSLFLEARTKEAPIEFVASGEPTAGRSLPHCCRRRRSSSRSLSPSRDSSLLLLTIRLSVSLDLVALSHHHHHVYSFSTPHETPATERRSNVKVGDC